VSRGSRLSQCAHGSGYPKYPVSQSILYASNHTSCYTPASVFLSSSRRSQGLQVQLSLLELKMLRPQLVAQPSVYIFEIFFASLTRQALADSVTDPVRSPWSSGLSLRIALVGRCKRARVAPPEGGYLVRTGRVI
jgi:hypothetical protein